MRKPEDPKCVGCENIKVACTYKPTPKQLEKARKQAAGNADPSVAYPGVEIGRRILPRPQAPAAGYGSSTAGSEIQPQYFEQPGSSSGRFAAGAQAQSQLPNEYSGMFGAQGLSAGDGGFDPRVNEHWQRRRVPEAAFQEPHTRPYGYSQYIQQPSWNSTHFGTQQNNFAQRSEQPAPEVRGLPRTPSGSSSVLGGYQPAPSGPSSAFGEPNFAFGGSPVGILPYARYPGLGLDGSPPLPPGDLPKPPEWRRSRHG